MDADVEVDVDANGLVCFALLRFALPARDVFARDAPKTHQYLVHSRLRGGGKPSASASSSAAQCRAFNPNGCPSLS